MSKVQYISREILGDVITNTAAKMKVSETIIEKDYWVCFILDYLFNHCSFRNKLVFKGGTSLSKCFGVIHRFSEDIDLILDWKTLGYDITEPWQDRSNTKQDKFNKEVNYKTEIFLKEQLLPILTSDLSNLIDDKFHLSIDENDKQTILFHYPKVFASPYLSEAVRLEIGSLAAWTPSKKMSIKSYISEHYPQLSAGNNITINTVAAERTFWEKATILHHEANRPSDLPMPSRYARHYYDMYMMSVSEYKEKAFGDIDLLEKVVGFKAKFYPRKWAQYENATVDKIKLLPASYRYNELEKDYNNMREMFFGEPPNFTDIMAQIAKLESEIHTI
ncbi:MAG: hypothetical protein CSB16_02880 [Clostridiales bacterium]|nr:MAG: hypothetical protein CSB16_02880 [Clostridiales bacterium]